MKELIEKLEHVIFLLEDDDRYDHHVASLNKAIQTLTSIKSEQVCPDLERAYQSLAQWYESKLKQARERLK